MTVLRIVGNSIIALVTVFSGSSHVCYDTKRGHGIICQLSYHFVKNSEIRE